MFRRIIENIYKTIQPWEDFKLQRSSVDLKTCFKNLYFRSQKAYVIRYIPVLNDFKIYKNNYSNILEVGSGSLGFSRLILKPIVGVDISIKGPHYENITLIKSSATNLPFPDNSFDLVVSMDMLEHIPRVDREKTVSELLRVTKKKLFLGMPCGHKAEKIEENVRSKYERILSNWKYSIDSKNVFIKRNCFLLEHYQHGLPKEEEVMNYIKKYFDNSRTSYDLRIEGNESIFVWNLATLSNMKYSYIRWFITTIFFIVLFPILSRIKWEGFYRKIFIIQKDETLEDRKYF